MSETYVLIHGAWHTGAELESVAQVMRKAGHTVHCPTLAGNRESDVRANVGLDDAIDSAIQYIEERDLHQVRLVGHSYGGMIVSGIADRVPHRISRLVYLNAFVPLDGESLNDMVPPERVQAFEEDAATNAQAVTLPFVVWREAFINDADIDVARTAYASLNPHPYRTFTDKIKLRTPTAALQLSKSFINCLQDTAMPHSLPWHPRLSERLGLFRLVECPGSHEMCFSNPKRLAEAILEAGRD
jgi:pimeloyl-ACP methyl ester carboxylesterase